MSNTGNLSRGFVFYCYAIALGIAYILAFWRPFGFNIFPYLTITDVLLAPLNRLVILFFPLFLILVLNIELRNKKNIKVPYYSFLLISMLFNIYAIQQLLKSIDLFKEYRFYFFNEQSILYLSGLLICISILLTFFSFFDRKNTLTQIFAISLAHIALSMSAGYSDGKAIFNGAESVHFLEQKELCESGGIRDWVYLEKFGENVFFMNTIEKKICILNDIKFNLVSRKYKEEL